MKRPDPKEYLSRQPGFRDYVRLYEYMQAMEAYCDYLERLIYLKIEDFKFLVKPS